MIVIGVCLPFVETASDQCLRRNISMEVWLRTSFTVWHTNEVRKPTTNLSITLSTQHTNLVKDRNCLEMRDLNLAMVR